MSKAQFGMIGLGTMGRNFLLNVAENGFAAVGYDIDPVKRELLESEGAEYTVSHAADLASFVAALESPRKLMLLVPAGPIVDSVIADLLPNLDKGDIIIDGGNSHFPDTERREASLKEKGIAFLGVGVSGGEEGARRGPSIMIGGDQEVYEHVRPILEAVAAKVNGEPCAAHVGRGSAGHFVKMVHNGIEYAMMQLIAETYDILRRNGTVSDQSISEIFAEWYRDELNSFLIEITATVLKKTDPETGNSLVSMILDTAGQKGTGKWTSQVAMDLGVPIPTIDSAVTMRQISAQKALRRQLAEHFPRINDLELNENNLRLALYASFIAAFTQGFALLRMASDEMDLGLDMVEISKIWRGGCIIRAAMLEDIRAGFEDRPELANLMLSERIRGKIGGGLTPLRNVVSASAAAGIPAMAFAASLNYLSAFTTERLPANLIQAQRDYFGAHTYQRLDREGTFHTDDWKN